MKYIIFVSCLITFATGCANKQNEGGQTAQASERSVQVLAPEVNAEEGVSTANAKPLQAPEIKAYCQKIEQSFKRWNWPASECEQIEWKKSVRSSVKGDPLIWAVLGKDQSKDNKENDKEGKRPNTTLVLCGVHGDEITPIKFCFDVIQYVRGQRALGTEAPHDLGNNIVIVAPLVNPDSYFKQRPTRTNENGVDINRNFPTQDWDKNALSIWRHQFGKDQRRFPGHKALSEPEVVFQVNLIKQYSPNKIITVHSPLTMLDYDGPTNQHTGGVVGSRANQLLIQMSEQAKGYRIKNYPFFTGSLGNYAGNERNIPTYTLELPSSDPSKSDIYWQQFRGAIHSAIYHDMQNDLDIAQQTKPTSKSPSDSAELAN